MVVNYFFCNMIFIPLLISSSVLYLEINSQTQSNCPDPSANLTNGVTGIVITTHDGELLGIRVTWRIKTEYLGCQFTNLRVELYISGQAAKIKNISVSNTIADFINEQFDCNARYTPRIRAVHVSSGLVTLLGDDGIPVFYRDRTTSPSRLSRVCVGPPTSQADRMQGKVNISWDPLPCHLQNGADVSYVIRYTHLSTGELANFSHSYRNVECRQEFAGPYSCLASSSLLFTHGMAYSFQVAAQNIYGVGSFSDPVITIFGSQDTNCTIRRFDIDVPDPASTTVMVSEESDTTTSNSLATNKITDVQYVCSTCEDRIGWIVMGSLVAIVSVLSGIVATILLIVIYVLWKRLKFNETEKKQTLMIMKHDKSSTNANMIDMKECSAYGQVISPQPVTEQPHIYESAT